MKIWTAYAGEHSARLKIIGTFEQVEDAAAAADLFNRLIEVADKHAADTAEFVPTLLRACADAGLSDFAAHDAPQLRLFEPIWAAGTEVRVETRQTDIQAILKVLIRYGARIEIITRKPCGT
jgi:Family of unknown function (DUF6375)